MADPWALPALAGTFAPFAIASTFTPGPNNVMLAASGANYGFARTIPHMAGIILGFPAMVVALGLGLGQLFVANPQIHHALNYVGAAYLLWLAWKTATASAMAEGGDRGRPLTFLQAAAFQWVNPKAWIMALGAIATYTTAEGGVIAEVLVIAATFFVAALPSTTIWSAGGVAIGQLLAGSPRALRIFNVTMGLLLAASVVQSFLAR